MTSRALRRISSAISTGQSSSASSRIRIQPLSVHSFAASKKIRLNSSTRRIGIGAGLAARPLPHHRAYGSVHGGSDWLPDRANRWKSKRSEVTIGQRNVQRRATTQAPYTVRRTHGLGGKVSGHSPRDQFPESGPTHFPLLPEETAKTPTNPFVQFPKYAGRFAETEVAAPARHISFQRTDQPVDADPSRALSQLPDSILEASQRLGRNAPFDLYSVREGESKEFARVWPRDRAFRLIDLQLQLAAQEGLEAFHHPLARAFAAYVDVTIVGVPHEA